MTPEDRHALARKLSYDMAEKMLKAYKILIEADFSPLTEAETTIMCRRLGYDMFMQLYNAGFTKEESFKIVKDTVDTVKVAKYKLL